MTIEDKFDNDNVPAAEHRKVSENYRGSQEKFLPGEIDPRKGYNVGKQYEKRQYWNTITKYAIAAPVAVGIVIGAGIAGIATVIYNISKNKK